MDALQTQPRELVTLVSMLEAMSPERVAEECLKLEAQLSGQLQGRSLDPHVQSMRTRAMLLYLAARLEVAGTGSAAESASLAPTSFVGVWSEHLKTVRRRGRADVLRRAAASVDPKTPELLFTHADCDSDATAVLALRRIGNVVE